MLSDGIAQIAKWPLRISTFREQNINHLAQQTLSLICDSREKHPHRYLVSRDLPTDVYIIE